MPLLPLHSGKKGVWAYVEGGMGALSESIAKSAESAGAEIVVGADVQEIIVDHHPSESDKPGVAGVRVVLEDGEEVEVATNFVLSNCTPHRTYTELLSPRDAEKLLVLVQEMYLQIQSQVKIYLNFLK